MDLLYSHFKFFSLLNTYFWFPYLVLCLYFVSQSSAIERRRNDRRSFYGGIGLSSSSTEEGSLRLVGGSSPGEGNLEVYHSGKWGSICDDEWGIEEANVACKALNFKSGALKGTDNSEFGMGKKLIWMDNVSCKGNESSLTQCTFDGWNVHDCSHVEAAGVICKVDDLTTRDDHYSINSISFANEKPVQFSRGYFSRLLNRKETRIQDLIGNLEVRIVGGRSEKEGRVEVRSSGQSKWGLICPDGWNLLSAGVVCHQLSHGYAEHALRTFSFGGSRGSFALRGLHCSGKETKLGDCRAKEFGPFVECSDRRNAAAVICTNELPDLVPDAKEIESSAYLEDKRMVLLQCALEENCLSTNIINVDRNDLSKHFVKQTEIEMFSIPKDWYFESRRLLRFTARIGNIGTAEFRPFVPKHLWQWHACHRHYHSMEVFAHFDITDRTGRKVAEGHKASFCLEDNDCISGVRPKYKCANYGDQGISVGCVDTYLHNLDCQWVDITDLPEGFYYFKVSINPEFKVAELNFDNNAALCSLYYNKMSARVWNCTLTSP